MPSIELTTLIKADIKTCFDLSRSIELHILSTKHTHEKAIAGKTSGLISMGEWVTWEAKHFFIKQQLTTKITKYDPPFYFCDEQVKGAFSSFAHHHYFTPTADGTVMKDAFDFVSPYGFVGKLFNRLVLTRYMKSLLIKRNQVIKDIAESGAGIGGTLEA